MNHIIFLKNYILIAKEYFQIENYSYFNLDKKNLIKEYIKKLDIKQDLIETSRK